MYDERKPIQTKAAPTAGPAADDRLGAGPVATNTSARIIKADVVGGRTRITIARGSEHGIHANMEGHVRVGGAVIADFQIDEVGPRVAYAYVDATVDQLGNARAHINPTTTARKPATVDVHTRVLAYSIEGAQTRITIARGAEHGITSGMSGHLVSASGQEGADFTIIYADATRAYAYVNNTTDHVAQHQQVVLRPMSHSGSPIQRRASGGASTVDVHATAQAGVAGAASRLPHFDAIQRAFGKHDISGVQAQVGGTATDASAALGARAYATGNKVAFASAPDLHTAAHEAAHTIQQQRGAVGFQGLGAADDEHERHADAVADAVVAGQSAEPLLDAIGDGSGSRAVQLKPEDKKPKRAPKGDEIDMPADYVGRDESAKPDNSRPIIDGGVDFSALGEAYNNFRASHNSIVNLRAIGVREVLGNLNEADSPSIAEDVLKVLATTALGAASGAILISINAKLGVVGAESLGSAIETALDDGFKEAVSTAFARLAAGGGTSKATFFASQEEALEAYRTKREREINLEERLATQAVLGAPSDRRAILLSEKLGQAQRQGDARFKSTETARRLQCEKSLESWMTAMAQDALGRDHGRENIFLGNPAVTDLGEALDVSPKNHYKKRGAAGVIHIALGQQRARRPMHVNDIKIVGITDAARNRIKDVPIRDLAIPVVATGYLYDGTVDALSISLLNDNEISIGRTEKGHVSAYGHEDALDALTKAAHASNPVEAARIVLQEDIGKLTLAKARLA